MFKELAPLVRHRAVLFTVTHVEEDQFRVNVIPKKVADGDNDALTTPVSVTGTAEDLDRELPQTLLYFVSSHLELKNTLERAKAEMEEASKAARAEAQKKSGSQAARKDPAGISNQPAAAKEAPVPARAETPRAAGLFDRVPEPAGVTEADEEDSGGAAPAEDSAADDEEEILRDAYSSRNEKRDRVA